MLSVCTTYTACVSTTRVINCDVWFLHGKCMHICVRAHARVCVHISLLLCGILSWWHAEFHPLQCTWIMGIQIDLMYHYWLFFCRQRCLPRQHEKFLSGSQFWSNLPTLSVVHSSLFLGSWDLALDSSSLSYSGISRLVFIQN